MPIKYTKEECQSYCVKWKTSKLSRQRFCLQENISESSLSKWLKRYESILKEEDRQPKLKFLPIEPIVNEKPKSRTVEIEILLPNGVLVKTATTSVAEIIKELLI